MATSTKDMTPEEWQLLANVGALFKELRDENNLTQKEAAKRIGTSQARFPILENGQADVMVTTLHRWATAYGYQLEIAVIKPGEEEDGGQHEGDSLLAG